MTADAVTVSALRSVPDWNFLPAPVIEPYQTWELTGPRQLSIVRCAVRQVLADAGDGKDTIDRTVLVIDELASNAVRHGALPARLMLCEHGDGWLVVATDAAPARLPVPAVNRPAEQGGMGLYVVADLSTSHGIECDRTSKHVWALLSRI